MKELSITLSRSMIGTHPRQRKTLQALGLKKMHQTVIKGDSPTVRGMLKTVAHLVTVIEQ
jgi:large subunit ribosomal protein L30